MFHVALRLNLVENIFFLFVVFAFVDQTPIVQGLQVLQPCFIQGR